MSLIDRLTCSGEEQYQLHNEACKVRSDAFGDLCEVRSVFEISNHCRQSCQYCAMACGITIDRFRHKAQDLERVLGHFEKRSSILLQSGEDPLVIPEVCRAIQKFPSLNITASFGSLEHGLLKNLKESGVERYILKFETSNEELHQRLRPTEGLQARLKKIDELLELGFKVSTGNIVGLPGQTNQMILEDLELMKSLGCDLNSTAPFIANELSSLGTSKSCDLDLVLNFIALMRVELGRVVIPSVSALNILDPHGQRKGFEAGANALTLHDAVHDEFAKDYLIYSKKRFIPKQSSLEVIRKAGLSPSFEALA